MERCVIKGGTVVRAEGVFQADVALANGRIAEIGENLSSQNATVVDATGCYVLPGAVDLRTRITSSLAAQSEKSAGAASHGADCAKTGRTTAEKITAGADASKVRPQAGSDAASSDAAQTADDALRAHWHTASLAAAYGGTTCIIEEPAPYIASVLGQGDALVRRIHAAVQGASVVDYGVCRPHWAGNAQGATTGETAIGEASAGSSGGCCHMYGDFALADEDILQVLQRVAAGGDLLRVHCANKAMDAYTAQRLQAQGSVGVGFVAQAFPSLSEDEAVYRLAALAQTVGMPVLAANISTAGAVAVVQRARQAGLPFFADTCPQYLLLDAACYDEGLADGLKYLAQPPLRGRGDRVALWEGLQHGGVAAVTSDHCAVNFASKWAISHGNIFSCPYGMPGVETRVPLLFAHGVLKGRITLSRFVACVATTPADLAGLPHKGRLAVGADADVVVFNPAEERSLTAGHLHQGADYTPFEGMKVRGWPQHVWVRGTQLIDSYSFTGSIAGQRVTVSPACIGAGEVRHA